jgi:choline-sulfatase
MDWGVWPSTTTTPGKGDYQVASWTVEQIKSAPKDQPFFIAAGFFLPHVPCYATQKWFDLYPDDDSVLPKIIENDRADTPRFSWYLHWNLPEPRLKFLKENNQWRNLVRSYLACTSFVDAQVGRLLTALDEAGHRDNTIVVLWGDHGWHLGEKEITGKNTLWDRGTKVPLIFAGPGVKAASAACSPPSCSTSTPRSSNSPALPESAPTSRVSALCRSSKTPPRNASAPPSPATTRATTASAAKRWRYIATPTAPRNSTTWSTTPTNGPTSPAKPENAAIIAEHKKVAAEDRRATRAEQRQPRAHLRRHRRGRLGRQDRARGDPIPQ